MVDFRKALGKGLAAAAAVEAVQRELQEVLGHFAAAVRDETNGEIAISLGPRSRGYLANMVWTYVQIGKDPPSVAEKPASAVQVVYAQLAGHPDITEPLCEIEIAPEGYPISVAWSGVLMNCHDRDSLEGALEAFAAHHQTGRRIAQLRARKAAGERAAASIGQGEGSPAADETKLDVDAVQADDPTKANPPK